MKTHQYGLSLVELLIAMTLGMFVILAVTVLVVSSKASQSTQINAADMHDTARFALDNITRSIKQAGYVNLDKDDAPFTNTDNRSPSILGLDDRTLNAKMPGIDAPLDNAINGSDVLAVRFFGSGSPTDHTVTNCAGYGEPADGERRWSIYYVANEAGGEPALFCKYFGKSNFDAQAIARGVESFQVLYGVDTDSPANAIANQFLSATEITALDAEIPQSELHKKTHWKRITAIKVALLIRSAESARVDSAPTTQYLFGANYKNASDKGTTILEADIPPTKRNRLRKVVGTTIALKNSVN